jgi:hypothetical protein
VVLDSGEVTDDLVGDVVEVLTPFCARLYGRRCGSIEFTSEYAEGILLVVEEYFEQALCDAQEGPDLDFLRSLVPYVWARSR